MSNQFVFSNNAATTLTSAVSSGSTTLSVASGAAFPVPGSGQQFAIYMTDAATGLVHEVMYVTANASNQFTVVRGQEGTSAASWAIGDIAQHIWSAGTVMPIANGGTGATAALAALEALGAFAATMTGVSVTTIWTSAAAGYYVDVQAVSTTQTLPAPSAASGMLIGFFASYVFTLTTPSGGFYGGSLDGTSSLSLIAEQFIFVKSDGTNWIVVSASPGLLGAAPIASPAFTGTPTSSGGFIANGVDSGGANFRATNDGYGVLLLNDGTNAYLLQTASGSPDGTFNTYRPFYWNLSTGAVEIDGTRAGTSFGGAATFDGAVTVQNATAAANPVALGQFKDSLGTDGYSTLPNGLTMQWGITSITVITSGGVSATVTVTFPEGFSTAALFMLANFSGDIAIEGAMVTSVITNTATGTITIWAPIPATYGLAYIAIGH